MGTAIADLLKSKKALTAIAAAIAAGGAKFGWDVTTDDLMPILTPIIAYVIGQGIADHGKERAKIENNTGG